MMASPPVLPLSNPTAATASAAAADSSAPPPAAIRLFLTRLTDSARRSLADRRPWTELLDRSAFSRPDSLSDAASRLRKNLAYFRVNYLALVAAALALSLLTNPGVLVALLALLAAWCLLYLLRPADQPLVLLGRTFSDRETLGGLVLLTVFVVFLTSVGSVIISAIMAGAAVVCAHGALRVPEDLFLDEQDSGASVGFLSAFLGGAASPAPPVTAARV